MDKSLQFFHLQWMLFDCPYRFFSALSREVSFPRNFSQCSVMTKTEKNTIQGKCSGNTCYVGQLEIMK